jgi:hypothetical protein
VRRGLQRSLAQEDAHRRGAEGLARGDGRAEEGQVERRARAAPGRVVEGVDGGGEAERARRGEAGRAGRGVLEQVVDAHGRRCIKTTAGGGVWILFFSARLHMIFL